MVQWTDPRAEELQAQHVNELARALAQQEAARKKRWWVLYEIFSQLADRIARLLDPDR